MVENYTMVKWAGLRCLTTIHDGELSGPRKEVIQKIPSWERVSEKDPWKTALVGESCDIYDMCRREQLIKLYKKRD